MPIIPLLRILSGYDTTTYLVGSLCFTKGKKEKSSPLPPPKTGQKEEGEKMAAPKLCAYCAQIPFRCLAMPTASEIRKARAAVKAGHTSRPIRLPYRDSTSSAPPAGFDSDRVDRTVDLGTLGRIRESSRRECPLCHLLLGVMERQGRRYLNDWTIPEDDDNVRIRAGTPHYGTIWETITGAREELYFIIQRLELSVHFVEDTEVEGGVVIPSGYPLALYSAVAQACNLDAEFGFKEKTEKKGVEDWEDVDDGKMLFCARKRPDVVDFDLVKSWIKLCQEEHGDICHIDHQKRSRQVSLFWLMPSRQ